jgi:hypothetical protein
MSGFSLPLIQNLSAGLLNPVEGHFKNNGGPSA